MYIAANELAGIVFFSIISTPDQESEKELEEFRRNPVILILKECRDKPLLIPWCQTLLGVTKKRN